MHSYQNFGIINPDAWFAKHGDFFKHKFFIFIPYFFCIITPVQTKLSNPNGKGVAMTKLISIIYALCLIGLVLILAACQHPGPIAEATGQAVIQTMPDHGTKSDSQVYDGYTLFSPMASKNTYLINNAGEIMKTWTSRNPIGSAVYLTNKGSLLRSERSRRRPGGYFNRGGGMGGILAEYGPEGTLLWEFELNTDTQLLHHDFIELKTKNILALSWKIQTVAGINYWNEKILEIDKTTQKIIWEWSALDHVVPNTRRPDFLHFNSIDYQNGKILVSVRSKNEIWVIDKTSGQITYTYGKDLYGQHDASFLDNGHILIFNNGRQSSSVLEIDPNQNKTIWQYENSFFSDHISGAQRLENGNTFICIGVSGEFIEVDTQGNLVWQYKNPFIQRVRSNRRMTSVFNAKKYNTNLQYFKNLILTPTD